MRRLVKQVMDGWCYVAHYHPVVSIKVGEDGDVVYCRLYCGRCGRTHGNVYDVRKGRVGYGRIFL